MTTTTETARTDLRRERGDRTRRAILETAAQLSSIEGLEELSIGRLAEHLGISKSGLYAHFRSKEELQLATIRVAEELYEEAMVRPAMDEPAGVARVIRFADLYLDYLRDGPFPGGCFFIAASIDPARNRGPVKEALAAAQADLLDFFADEIGNGQALGEIPDDVPARDLAFAADGMLTAADLNYLLFDDANLSRACKAGRAPAARAIRLKRQPQDRLPKVRPSGPLRRFGLERGHVVATAAKPGRQLLELSQEVAGDSDVLLHDRPGAARARIGITR